MPGIANVHEDTTVETLVYNLTVTDSDPVTCYLTNTVPVDAPFILKRHLTTPGKKNPKKEFYFNKTYIIVNSLKH